MRDPKTLIEERWWGDDGWKETDLIMPVLLFGSGILKKSVLKLCLRHSH